MLLVALLPCACAAGAVSSQFTPSGNYTPVLIACPQNQTYIRPASSGLSPAEQAWLSVRRPNIVNALETYLNNVAIPGFNVTDYISRIKANETAVPTIGLTLSGGGNRAQLSGLGVYQALDARYGPAWSSKTGGILQATSYISSCKFRP